MHFSRSLLVPAFLALAAVACGPVTEDDASEARGAQSETEGDSSIFSPSPELRAALAPMLAAGRIDSSGFERRLRPLLEALPGRASGDARSMVDVYFRPNLTIDPPVKDALATLIASWGYRLDDARDAAAAIESNVTESDPAFSALCRAVAPCKAGELLLGVIDGGFLLDHPALEGRFAVNRAEVAGNRLDDDGNGVVDDVFGFNFQQGVGDLSYEGPFGDGSSLHGTHVAAIAARGTSKIALIGTTAANTTYIAQSIDYLAARGARVVSFSLSAWTNVDEVLAAFDRHPDILFLESAGNEGVELGVSPERQPSNDLATNKRANFVKVASAEADGTKQSSSNFSREYVDLAAVGPHYSAIPKDLVDSGYVYQGKTSQATPAAANVAARIRLLAPHLGAPEVRRLLAETSDRSPAWDGVVAAGGIVNPLRAGRAAALLTLMREGATLDTAFDRLSIPEDERPSLRSIVGRPRG